MLASVVLIVVFANAYSNRDPATLTVGFENFAACETARKHIAKTHTDTEIKIVSQGCYATWEKPK